MATAKDAGLVKYGVSPARYDETLFAWDKVRYVGDEIAAVAAVDQDTAQEALDLIRVDYEELPAVFDMFEAMKEGASRFTTNSPRISMRKFTRSSVTRKQPLPSAISWSSTHFSTRGRTPRSWSLIPAWLTSGSTAA